MKHMRIDITVFVYLQLSHEYVAVQSVYAFQLSSSCVRFRCPDVPIPYLSQTGRTSRTLLPNVSIVYVFTILVRYSMESINLVLFFELFIPHCSGNGEQNLKENCPGNEVTRETAREECRKKWSHRKQFPAKNVQTVAEKLSYMGIGVTLW